MPESVSITRPSCTPEAKRAYNIAYRIKHREKLLAAKKAWWNKVKDDPVRKGAGKNRPSWAPEARQAYNQAYYAENKERMKAEELARYHSKKNTPEYQKRKRAWREANAEHLKKKKHDEWVKKNPNPKILPPRPWKNCKQCGRSFKTLHDKHILCSGDCAGIYRRTCPRKRCPICKKIFVRRNPNRTFCSEGCKAIRRNQFPVHKKACDGCGETFSVSVNRKQNHRFCSFDCGVRFRNKRNLELKKQPGAITKEEWESMLVYFDGRCGYCHKSTSKIAQDHMVPASKGGTSQTENIVPACPSCNSSKKDRNIIEWMYWLRWNKGNRGTPKLR